MSVEREVQVSYTITCDQQCGNTFESYIADSVTDVRNEARASGWKQGTQVGVQRRYRMDLCPECAERHPFTRSEHAPR